MNDDVPPCWYLREILPKDLANTPSDTIADHRAAQRFLHADAEPAVREMIGPNENYELAARASLPAAIDRFIFHAANQAYTSWKTKRWFGVAAWSGPWSRWA